MIETQSMLLDTLDQLVVSHADEIDAWFTAAEAGREAPFYASVDIRNSGHKMAVVDTNLFPAGFNNLCDYSYKLAAEQIKIYFALNHPAARRILIVPESNTRNPGYTANVARLHDMLTSAGFEAAVGTLIDSVPSAGAELEGIEGTKVTLLPFRVEGGIPFVGDKAYDIVLLNHDLSGGEPPILKSVTVPIVPRAVLGWHRRRKSMHFARLSEWAARFGERFGIDPWLISAETESVEGVRFDEPDKSLRESVERVFAKTQAAFQSRGIDEKPYVFVKHDAGTYGMGVMSVDDPAELDSLSRDLRKKMAKGKGGVAITDVIVQEGIPTRDRVRDIVGEPVIYTLNNHIIGGFFRLHSEADDRVSLNKPGQVYYRLCSTPSIEQSRSTHCYHDSRLFHTYGILSRLAGLAVISEREELEGS